MSFHSAGVKEGHGMGAQGSIFAAEKRSIGPFAQSHAVKYLFVIGFTLHTKYQSRIHCDFDWQTMVNFEMEVLSVRNCMITSTNVLFLSSKIYLSKFLTTRVVHYSELRIGLGDMAKIIIKIIFVSVNIDNYLDKYPIFVFQV